MRRPPIRRTGRAALNPEKGEAREAITSSGYWAPLSDADIGATIEIDGPCTLSAALGLYDRCDLSIFPSIIESFGFPLVEAMAHSPPILASDTLVNRDICGEAVVYFPLFDFKELVAQIEHVAGDSGLRGAIVKEGASRVRSRFRWDVHVRRVLDTASGLVARPCAAKSSPL